MKRAFEIIELARGKESNLEDIEKVTIELASCMLEEANRTQTYSEKKNQAQLARMMNDPTGKAFTTCMTDQGFRSHSPLRVANQINYLIDKFGIPKYFDFFKRLQLAALEPYLLCSGPHPGSDRYICPEERNLLCYPARRACSTVQAHENAQRARGKDQP
jgi:hypothetical protein